MSNWFISYRITMAKVLYHIETILLNRLLFLLFEGFHRKLVYKIDGVK